MTDQACPPGEEDSATALRRALRLREAGDMAGAAALYRDLAARHPGEAGIWAMLGDALRVAGDPAAGATALRARGADIAIRCHAKLAGLFETLDGSPTLFATGAPLPPVDAHVPLMSLPHMLGTTADTVPAGIPYLRAPANARRPPSSDGRRRIGLCWSGNPEHPDNPHRSLPFDAFAPLLARHDADWRGMQFGPAAAEAAQYLPDDPAWTACLEGFGNTAAALESCDLVVTIDTSTAHLAGALGRPVWLLLKYAPDWRWMVGREDSPWYPTVHLFRQAAPGDWTGVMARLETALANLLEC